MNKVSNKNKVVTIVITYFPDIEETEANIR